MQSMTVNGVFEEQDNKVIIRWKQVATCWAGVFGQGLYIDREMSVYGCHVFSYYV